MRKVFAHENRLIVFHIKNLLQDQGIRCQLRNEFAAGGVGDLAPFETWPELWVAEDDLVRASTLIADLDRVGDSPVSLWKCPRCGEVNEANFGVCWNCQHSRANDL